MREKERPNLEPISRETPASVFIPAASTTCSGTAIRQMNDKQERECWAHPVPGSTAVCVSGVTGARAPQQQPGGRGQEGSHLTGPKLKAMKRRKTTMQTTFLFPDPNLSSLF